MVVTTTSTIEARGLAKRFGDVVAVDGIDVTANAGQCLGVLGPNGAGKTTTIEMLEGLREPDRGEIRVLGMTWKDHGASIRERMGVQLQETQLPEKLRVFEVVRVFASLYRAPKRRKVDEVLALVGLEEKRKALVTELSGGQRQRLSLGCALVHHPDVLFLDEPTTGLDPQGRRRVWSVIEEFKRGGGTVLLTTHFMEEAERLADELLIVDRGKVILSGTPARIVESLKAESIVELSVARADEPASGTWKRAPVEEIRALREDTAMVLRDESTANLPTEAVSALPGVLSVQRRDGRLRVGVDSIERALPALIALVSSRGLKLVELTMHRPTLEDAFLSVTGREMRES